MPTLRDSKQGWLSLAVIFYCLVADVGGLLLLLASRFQSVTTTALICGILLSAHGRILATYLVHEAAHSNIFREPLANRWFGRLCLWLAGCPYADFAHIKKMHRSHHLDRNDTIEFDFRTLFEGKFGYHIIMNTVLAMEFCFIPAIETLMHLRTALLPLVASYSDSEKTEGQRMTSGRFHSALIGSVFMVIFYSFLYQHGVLFPHLAAGAIVLQFLSLNDAFQHTYEAVVMSQYTPGPGDRTAQYEQENTFSTLVSTDYPILNTILCLNFGYHNAHHHRAMTPWYRLPSVHETLYGGSGDKHHDCSQVLPYSQILVSWYRHRLRRVLEDDYGSVGELGEPRRTDNFVGAVGVSFLTG